MDIAESPDRGPNSALAAASSVLQNESEGVEEACLDDKVSVDYFISRDVP